MKTCVIGGNGFIEKHLFSELQKIKSNIVVVSRSKIDIPNVESIEVQSFFDRKREDLVCNEVDKVVCLAYATKPKTSFENPIRDIEDNLAQTFHLFELIAKTGRIKKVVYVSFGGAIYGNTHMDFINEKYTAHTRWNPETSIQEGVEQTWNYYYSNNLGEFKQ
jgi:UDP-glucose 4-epimerase